MQLIVKEDKLQKYRNHIQEGAPLSTKDKELFDRYFFTFTNLLDGLSERKVVELLMYSPVPLGGISQSQAYNVVNGAQEIFGQLDISNSKKVAQRYIYATRLEEMAAGLEAIGRKMLDDNVVERSDTGRPYIDPDIQKEAAVVFEKSANILMKAAKIKGLLEKDKVENPNKFKVAPNIIFTDDLNGLELMREIEETGFEDVTTDEGETEEGTAETAGE